MTDAERNARAKLEDIVLLVGAMTAVNGEGAGFFTEMVREELDGLGVDFERYTETEEVEKITDGEGLAERIREVLLESPLSVQVRSGWYSPGVEPPEAVEYEIMLTTGGPAARIVGSLGLYGEPNDARLEHQDWGTPWTACHTTVSEDDMLLAYAQQFYCGG